jgi:hypothetical protein
MNSAILTHTLVLVNMEVGLTPPAFCIYSQQQIVSLERDDTQSYLNIPKPSLMLNV